MQLQLAGIVAAAAHVGLISVHEGVCDVIDASSPMYHKTGMGRPSDMDYVNVPFSQWSRLVAEQYMDPAMPGASPAAHLRHMGHASP